MSISTGEGVFPPLRSSAAVLRASPQPGVTPGDSSAGSPRCWRENPPATATAPTRPSCSPQRGRRPAPAAAPQPPGPRRAAPPPLKASGSPHGAPSSVYRFPQPGRADPQLRLSRGKEGGGGKRVPRDRPEIPGLA